MSSTTPSPATLRHKRLLYRSSNRGTKETDLLLGTFAKHYFLSLTEDELTEFERLLEESDNDIFDWLTQKKAPPSTYTSALFTKLWAFQYADFV